MWPTSKGLDFKLSLGSTNLCHAQQCKNFGQSLLWATANTVLLREIIQTYFHNRSRVNTRLKSLSQPFLSYAKSSQTQHLLACSWPVLTQKQTLASQYSLPGKFFIRFPHIRGSLSIPRILEFILKLSWIIRKIPRQYQLSVSTECTLVPFP